MHASTSASGIVTSQQVLARRGGSIRTRRRAAIAVIVPVRSTNPSMRKVVDMFPGIHSWSRNVIPAAAASSTMRTASSREWTNEPLLLKTWLCRCNSVGLRNPAARSSSLASSRSAGRAIGMLRGRGRSSRSTSSWNRSLSTNAATASYGAMLAGNRWRSSGGRPATASAQRSLHGIRTASGRSSAAR